MVGTEEGVRGVRGGGGGGGGVEERRGKGEGYRLGFGVWGLEGGSREDLV